MPLANVSSGSETMEETATVPIMSEQHIKTEVRVKTVFKGEVMIHYLDDTVQYEELCKEIRGICRFTPETVSLGPWSFTRMNFTSQKLTLKFKYYLE